MPRPIARTTVFLPRHGGLYQELPTTTTTPQTSPPQTALAPSSPHVSCNEAVFRIVFAQLDLTVGPMTVRCSESPDGVWAYIFNAPLNGADFLFEHTIGSQWVKRYEGSDAEGAAIQLNANGEISGTTLGELFCYERQGNSAPGCTPVRGANEIP